MNLTPLTPFERHIAELEKAQHAALVRRLAEDQQDKFSKITEAAIRRMELFRAQQPSAKGDSPKNPAAASSPATDSDLTSESESSIDSA